MGESERGLLVYISKDLFALAPQVLIDESVKMKTSKYKKLGVPLYSKTYTL